MEVGGYSSEVGRIMVCSMVEALLVDTLLAAGLSLNCLLTRTAYSTNDSWEFYPVDKRFPVDELHKMQRPGPENTDGSDTEEEEEEEDAVEGDDDDEGDEDFSGEEGGDDDPEDDAKANGQGGSDDEDEDEDEDNGSNDDEDEEEDEDEDEDEEELHRPAKKKK